MRRADNCAGNRQCCKKTDSLHFCSLFALCAPSVSVGGAPDQNTLTRPESAITMVVSPLIVARVALVISPPDMIVHSPVI
ncbi:MAG: hypothetical protein QOJ99_5936 [Bryobacterales bacterium]|nr:hypothetical protein [Bryobacterales bacterium]